MLQTQWRVGFHGRTGLDYAAVAAYLELHDRDPDSRRAHFAGIRAAELATLEVWAERALRHGDH